MTMLTQERVRALFDYDPETGALTWRYRPASDFISTRACKTWNARFSGKPVNSRHRMGYFCVRIDYVAYFVHRVIWLYVYGSMPEMVDHINHDGFDNRILNLREVPSSVNQKNQSRSRRNKSGKTGVYWSERFQRWKAEIFVNGKKICLGSFREKDDAVKARTEADERFRFHPNHGLARAFARREEAA
jgi:hypothetical protein